MADAHQVLQMMKAFNDGPEFMVTDGTHKLLRMSSGPLNESEVESAELSNVFQSVRAVSEDDLVAIGKCQTIAAEMFRTLSDTDIGERDLRCAG